MLKCLVILFLIVGRLQCRLNTLRVAYGYLFSNQLVFTMSETEVFKYNF